MEKIPSKYAGQCIAMINKRVVAAEKTSLEAYRKAKQAYPNEMITLMCVPRKNEIITFL